MPCDATVILGKVVVDESMLTGESIPVIKTQLPKDYEGNFDTNGHANHILFSGIFF